MWIESDEDGTLNLYYYTIDVYKSVGMIRHNASPMPLDRDYSPMWTSSIFFKALVF
jgi:hypothetical protein